MGTWSRNLDNFPPLSLEIVENSIKRLSVTPKASDNRGYALFNGAYIHDFEEMYTTTTVRVRARSYRSQSKNADTHHDELSLGLTGTLEKWQCSCKAGNGFCQHAVATLYQAADNVKTKCRTVPSQHSRTSSPQSWGTPRRTAGFCTRPIHDITVKSVKKSVISPSTSTNSTNGVSPFPAKRRQVSEGVRSTMYNPVNVPLCDLKIGDKLTPLLQTVEPRPQSLDVLDDEEANIVNSRYGPVSFGCVLAYQQPPGVLCMDADNDSCL